jgi:hypothetical protein
MPPMRISASWLGLPTAYKYVSAGMTLTGKLRPSRDRIYPPDTCLIDQNFYCQGWPERRKRKKYSEAGVVPLTKDFPYKSTTMKV